MSWHAFKNYSGAKLLILRDDKTPSAAGGVTANQI